MPPRINPDTYPSRGFKKFLCLQHLKTMRPLLDDEQYQEMALLSEEFLKGVGRKLQWYLHLKSWFSSNYVSFTTSFIVARGR